MSNLKAPKRSSACPCHSGKSYGDCCQPLHRGTREAESPEALMRSRYAAYAVGDVDYLVRTLHPEHKDGQIPADVLRSSLKAACASYRYTGLEILEVKDADESGRASVHFRARVFQKGADLSFSERSRFAQVGSSWRYLDGETTT